MWNLWTTDMLKIWNNYVGNKISKEETCVLQTVSYLSYIWYFNKSILTFQLRKLNKGKQFKKIRKSDWSYTQNFQCLHSLYEVSTNSFFSLRSLLKNAQATLNVSSTLAQLFSLNVLYQCMTIHVDWLWLKKNGC